MTSQQQKQQMMISKHSVANDLFVYDSEYPPLCIRAKRYEPPTESEWKQIHGEFFARIQKINDQPIYTKALLSSGMECQEFAFRHLRDAHKQRKTRNNDDDDDDEDASSEGSSDASSQ